MASEGVVLRVWRLLLFVVWAHQDQEGPGESCEAAEGVNEIGGALWC